VTGRRLLQEGFHMNGKWSNKWQPFFAGYIAKKKIECGKITVF
jgi:hypothetical protein